MTIPLRRLLATACAAIVVLAGLSVPSPIRARAAAPQPATTGAPATPQTTPVTSTGALGALRAGSAAGTLTSTIAIQVPPDHGIAPTLSLSYDSSAGNGWLGVGWSLSGPDYITRQSAARGVAEMTAQDRFQLDGVDLVQCSDVLNTGISPGCRVGTATTGSSGCPAVAGAAYSYWTTRREADELVCRTVPTGNPDDETWTVTTADGTSSELEAAAPTPLGPVSFVTHRVTDPRGNEVDYQWSAIPGAVPEPTEIDYPGARVIFHEQDRPDLVTVAVPRGVLTVAHRLAAVEVDAAGAVARVSALGYRTSDDTGRSVLASVTQYGAGSTVAADGTVTGPALPTQTFTTDSAAIATRWPAGSAAAAATGTSVIPNSTGVVTTAITASLTSYRIGNFDDTGRAGMVVRTDDPSQCSRSIPLTLYRHVDAAPASVALRMPDGRCPSPTVDAQGDPDFGPWWLADLNGDGIDDVVLPTLAGDGTRLAVYFGQPDGSFATLPHLDATAMPYTLGCAPGDVAGNGHLAIACEYDTASDDRVHAVSADFAGDLTGTDQILSGAVFVPGQVMLGDVNGDGRADLVRTISRGSTYIDEGTGWNDIEPLVAGIQTFLARPDGSYGPAITTWFGSGTPGDWSQPVLALQLADLNGDGEADVVATTLRHVTAVEVSAISRGDGTWSLAAQALPGWLETQMSTSGSLPVLNDIDGDGSSGLSVTVERGAHATPSACAPPLNYDHLEVLRASSRGNGAFAWPTSMDDCSHDQELTVDLSRSFWEQIGDFFTDLWRTVASQASDPRSSYAVADADGDGRSDMMLLLRRTTASSPELVVGYASHSGVASDDWLAGSLDDSGRTGYVQVRADYGLASVRTLRPRTTPPPPSCRTDPTAAQCNPYSSNSQYLLEPTDPTLARHQPLVPQDATGWHLLDLTGNGRDSLVYIDDTRLGPVPGRAGLTPAVLILVYLASSSGFSTLPRVTWLPRNQAVIFSPWQPGSVRGDGSAGLLAVETGANGSAAMHALTFNADGGAADRVTPISIDGFTDRSWRVAETNADGRSDLVQVHPDGAGKVDVQTILSAAVGYGSWQGTFPSPGADDDQQDWLVGDTTGDGIDDLSEVHDNGGTTTVSTLAGAGRDWTPLPPAPPLNDPSPGAPGGRWLALDVTGGGSADLVRLLPVGQGAGGASTLSVRLLLNRGGSGYTDAPTQTLAEPAANAYHWQVVDGDGDGVDDLANLSGVLSARVDLRITHAGGDRLTGVSDGLGGAAAVGYTPSSTDRVGSACAQLPSGVGAVLVATVTVYTGSAATTTGDNYACPTWSTDLRHVLGWNKVSSTRAVSPVLPAVNTTTQYQLSASCGALPVATWAVDAAGVRVSDQTQGWNSDALAGQPVTCAPAVRRTVDCGDTGCGPAADQESWTYDGDGNVTANVESAFTGGTLLSERSTVAAYQYDTIPYVVDLPVLRKTGPGPTPDPVLTETRYCWDGDCTGTAADARGLLSSQTLVDPTGQLPDRVTRNSYDRYGNLTTSTDPSGNTTSIAWDSATGTLPVASTDALRHTTAVTWDPIADQPATITDPNGNTSRYRYDAFGRLTSTASPDGSSMTVTYPDWGDPARQGVLSTTADGAWSKVSFDGLARPTSLTTASDDPTDPDVTITGYADANAEPAWQSHWSVASTAAAAPTEHYDYDPLGRTVVVAHPDGSRATTAYLAATTGTTITTTDEAGHTTTDTADPWGRQTAVTQPTGSGGSATSTSSYDAADQLISTTSPSGTSITEARDGFGEVTSEADPDRGTTSLSYDADGNTITSTDADGNTVNYAYDALGRPVTRSSTDDRTTWQYDAGSSGAQIGQLTRVTDTSSAAGCAQSVSELIRYDAVGRMSTDTTCVGGRSETIGQSFDADGRLAALAYPGGEQVSVGYDAAGRPTSEGSYVRDAQYDPSGQLTNLALGNGTQQVVSYDPTRGWAVADTVLAPDGTALAGDTSTRNLDATVSSTTETGQGTTQAFSYDPQRRLTSTAATGADAAAASATVSYNADGDIEGQSQLGTYGYGTRAPPCPTGPPAHGVTSIGFAASAFTTTFCYDAAGRRTVEHDPFDTVTLGWDALGRPDTIATHPLDGAKDAHLTLTWAPDGGLARQVGHPGTDTRYYAGGLAQLDSRTGLTTRYYFAGRLVAVRTGTAVSYVHTDGLSSPDTVLDEHGAITARISYDAWGRRTTTVGTLPAGLPGFAGTTPLQDTSLLQAGVRLYDPDHGDVVSPDPMLDSAPGVLGTNAYAYATDDPTSTTDPTGLEDAGEDAGSGGTGQGTLVGDQPFGDDWIDGWGPVDGAEIVAFDEEDTVIGGAESTPSLAPSAPGSAADDAGTPPDAAPATNAEDTASLTGGGSPPTVDLDAAGKAVVATTEVAGLGAATWALATGLGEILAGGLGEFFGVGLDATGVGAPAGVVLNIAAAGVVAAGAVTVAVAARGVVDSIMLMAQNSRSGGSSAGPGRWGTATESMSPRASRYQQQITNRPAGSVYRANGVKFDGFDGKLLEAKGPGYARFVKNGQFRSWFKGSNALLDQATRQLAAANGTPIVWIVAEPASLEAIEALFAENGVSGIELQYVPPGG